MDKRTVDTIIKTLFKNNSAFCSEADFQHSFAMEIERSNGINRQVRLEYPIDQNNADHFDIMVIEGGKEYPIELKYKTRKTAVKDRLGNVLFYLKTHGAQNIGRYSFLKDVYRIEEFKMNNKKTFGMGCAIILTNDHLYMDNSKGKTSQSLCLNNGISSGNKSLNTQATWARNKSSFYIKGNYKTDWQRVILNGIEFYYLIVFIT